MSCMATMTALPAPEKAKDPESSRTKPEHRSDALALRQERVGLNEFLRPSSDETLANILVSIHLSI
jgi:hypothetical protein